MRAALVDSSAGQEWANYEFAPSFVLGFHGCDEEVGEAILRGEAPHLRPSQNEYDWVGHGIYFWEGNPARALQFAQERTEGGRNAQGSIIKPFVLGAIIHMGRCLDLADASAIAQVKNAHAMLESITQAGGGVLPSHSRNLKARFLDCLVFNTLHRLREASKKPPYDTVRGLFLEGDEIYPGAGVRQANHIQICVRESNGILGYFRPIKAEAP